MEASVFQCCCKIYFLLVIFATHNTYPASSKIRNIFAFALYSKTYDKITDEIYSLFIPSVLHFLSLSLFSPSYHLPHVKCETTTYGGKVGGGGA
jgi:hypothetical protein